MKNHKIIALNILFSLIVFAANAQRIGVKGGLTLSTMIEKTETYSLYDISMISGFHIGADIDFKLNKILTLEPGLILTTTGSEYKYDRMGINHKLTYNEYYINLPILIKAEFNLCNKMKIYSIVGPYIGTGFGGELQETKVAINDFPSEFGFQPETTKKDYSKDTAYGITLGIGIERNSIFFESSYDYGLDYDKDQAADVYFPDQSRLIRFTIGYRI